MTMKQEDKIRKAAEYCAKKYKKTYQMLEAYDTGTQKIPEKLVKHGSMRKYFQFA